MSGGANYANEFIVEKNLDGLASQPLKEYPSSIPLKEYPSSIQGYSEPIKEVSKIPFISYDLKRDLSEEEEEEEEGSSSGEGGCKPCSYCMICKSRICGHC